MKLTKQVTSLKLSKKLEELGVKQESLFYWINMYPSGGDTDNLYTLEPGYRENSKSYSAFTVAELGERLPTINQTNQFGMNCPLNLLVEKQEKSWWCCYGGAKRYIIRDDKSEANARALLLIYLIENKLIKKGHKK